MLIWSPLALFTFACLGAEPVLRSRFLNRIMTRTDDAIIELALKVRFLTLDQLTEIRHLQKVLEKNGVPEELTGILIRKDFLTSEQLRLLKIGIRHDRARDEDVALGIVLGRSGSISQERIREALRTQEDHWKAGREFPRLGKLLVETGAATPDQLQEITGDSPPGTKTDSTKKKIKKKAPSRKNEKLGISVEGCRVQVRRAPARKSGKHDHAVSILDFAGLLDGHTYRHFEEFLNRLILEEDRATIVINCRKLDYLSSAGVGILASAVKLCRDNKGDLCLFDVPEQVKRVINLVGLQSLLRIYDDEKGAVASFR